MSNQHMQLNQFPYIAISLGIFSTFAIIIGILFSHANYDKQVTRLINVEFLVQ
jgi:hypothetical protein